MYVYKQLIYFIVQQILSFIPLVQTFPLCFIFNHLIDISTWISQTLQIFA